MCVHVLYVLMCLCVCVWSEREERDRDIEYQVYIVIDADISRTLNTPCIIQSVVTAAASCVV